MSSRTVPWPMMALAKAASPGEARVRADDGCAVSNLACDADRLAAPRVVLRLEGTGEKIQQADFRLGDDFGIEATGSTIEERRAPVAPMKLRLVLWIRSSWQSPSRDGGPGLAAHFHAGPFLQHFCDRGEVGMRRHIWRW